VKIHRNLLIILGKYWIFIFIKYFSNISRIRCSHLTSFVLSDGSYYEAAKANFERAERYSVVRTATMYQTSIISTLSFYNELKFN